MLTIILRAAISAFGSREALVLENLALRHQIQVLRRSSRRRPRLSPLDRGLWVLLSRICGIEDVPIAPRSPWQNAFVERLIGSVRRECLDHVVVLNEMHLRRVLREYLNYYEGSRTHLSLAKDCPEPRPIELPSAGNIIAIPHVGGLHHRYTRRAA